MSWVVLIRLNIYEKDINVKTVVIEEKYIDKETIFTDPLPRFLWIIRTYYDRIPTMDDVYNGTAVFPKKNFVNRIDQR